MTAPTADAHTPGPWHVHGDDDHEGVPFIEVAAGEYGPTFKSICDVRCTLNESSDEFEITDEDRANARLIAALPDFEQGAIAFVEYEKAVAAGNDVAAMMHYATASKMLRAALTAAKTGGAK